MPGNSKYIHACGLHLAGLLIATLDDTTHMLICPVSFYYCAADFCLFFVACNLQRQIAVFNSWCSRLRLRVRHTSTAMRLSPKAFLVYN